MTTRSPLLVSTAALAEKHEPFHRQIIARAPTLMPTRSSDVQFSLAVGCFIGAVPENCREEVLLALEAGVVEQSGKKSTPARVIVQNLEVARKALKKLMYSTVTGVAEGPPNRGNGLEHQAAPPFGEAHDDGFDNQHSV